LTSKRLHEELPLSTDEHGSKRQEFRFFDALERPQFTSFPGFRGNSLESFRACS
jgi:hypothetical protein